MKRLKSIFSFALYFFTVTSPIFSQDYFERNYPAYGGGVICGYSWYFPKDLNDYIQNQISNLKEDRIHTGINVGFFLIFAPTYYLEITPEFAYLYTQHAFDYPDVNLVVSGVQMGGTIYYKKKMYPGINLRVGGGLSNYWSSVSWEYVNWIETWKGSKIGYHGTIGVELVVSPKMSVSFLMLGRYANITPLNHQNGYIVKKHGGGNNNLNLSFSGIEFRILMSYYF